MGGRGGAEERTNGPHPCHCEQRSAAATPPRTARPCHCEERSDAAIPTGRARCTRLLRSARNDNNPHPRGPAPSHVIARSAATKQSRKVGHDVRDCFAPLAMTIFPARTAAAPPRHCEERSDAAIPPRTARCTGLLRSARNDNNPYPRGPAPSHVIARSAATKQSRKVGHDVGDCFAPLAMTIIPIQEVRPRPMSLRGAQRRGNPERSGTM